MKSVVRILTCTSAVLAATFALQSSSAVAQQQQCKEFVVVGGQFKKQQGAVGRLLRQWQVCARSIFGREWGDHWRAPVRGREDNDPQVFCHRISEEWLYRPVSCGNWETYDRDAKWVCYFKAFPCRWVR